MTQTQSIKTSKKTPKKEFYSPASPKTYRAEKPEVWASERIMNFMMERLEAYKKNPDGKKIVLPWQATWSRSTILPRRHKTNRVYHGLNLMMLLMTGYGSPFYFSYKDISELGGKVIKGQHGWPVSFWFEVKKELADGTKEGTGYWKCRYFNIFNLEQTEGIDPAKLRKIVVEEDKDHNPIEECEAIVAGYENPPKIVFKGQQPCYRPLLDQVDIPAIKKFKTPEAYYATLFHELAHSTGSDKRLNRETLVKVAGFGSHLYSEEELVAEACAAMLCRKVGIENTVIDNSLAYIENWMKALTPEVLATSIKAAGKAYERIVGNSEAEENNDGEE
jgi:antirestriction protein ArdC